MKLNNQYIRIVIFAVEDSLVSTTALIAGISAGTNNKSVVVISGMVAIAVGAISISASEYISDDAIEESAKSHRGRSRALTDSAIMLAAYFLASLIPLLPVIFFSYPASLYVSIASALMGLVVLGYIKSKVLHTNPLKGIMKVVIVGGLATALGVLVGLKFRV